MSADTTETSPASVLQPTEQMWREMLPRLRKFVRRRLADPDRADDIIAEILLRIHQNAASLDDHELLPNWVFRIARNAVIDEYRRAGRSREQLTATLQNQPIEPPTDQDESAAVVELSACLRPMLNGLPAEQRDALEMVNMAGMTQADAAQRADLAFRNEVPRQRGRRRLAELLGQWRTYARRSRRANGLRAAAELRVQIGQPATRLTAMRSRCFQRCPGLRSSSRTRSYNPHQGWPGCRR